jgi:hypothetical protein
LEHGSRSLSAPAVEGHFDEGIDIAWQARVMYEAAGTPLVFRTYALAAAQARA